MTLAFVVALTLRGSAAFRHALWTCAAVALLALPLVQALAPPLPAPLPRIEARRVAPSRRETKPLATTPHVSALVPERAQPSPRPLDPSAMALAFWSPEGLQALRVLSRSTDAAVRDEVAETLHDMAERAQRH